MLGLDGEFNAWVGVGFGWCFFAGGDIDSTSVLARCVSETSS
jgi:hypothetical protein